MHKPKPKPMAWNELVDVISSDEDSEMEVVNPTHDTSLDHITPQDALMRRAEMYQQYMKQIPIPQQRGSVIPFTSWTGLGISMKKLYGQPLHYLTNVQLKQWDQLRIGSEEEYTPLDITMHPAKAEAAIWLAEEVHRRTSSPHHIAKLWLSDPMHHSYVDSIFPKLS